MKKIYQKIRLASLFVLTIFFMTSCNNAKKNDFTFSDFKGKTFVQFQKTPINPELGGAGFIKFETEDKLSIKTGDIISTSSYKIVNNNTLQIKPTFGEPQEFKIINDSILKDSYDIEWKMEKN